MKKNKKGKIKIIAISFASILVILISVFYVYTLDYYRADSTAIQAFSQNETINVQDIDNMIVFYPDKEKDIDIGFIFYPGGKVEAKAYSPLLSELTNKGITCVLLKMPFNLAVFNIKAADKVYEKFPNIQNWYLGGHSLGGAMASSYAEKNSHKLKGLILLGAYPINDSDISTLAIYGSEDDGLDKTKLKETKNKLEITGGNHAYFGDYGEQKGDGTASITRDKQQSITIDSIIDFIQKQ
jgi:hypothetical protein